MFILSKQNIKVRRFKRTEFADTHDGDDEVNDAQDAEVDHAQGDEASSKEDANVMETSWKVLKLKRYSKLSISGFLMAMRMVRDSRALLPAIHIVKLLQNGLEL